MKFVMKMGTYLEALHAMIDSGAKPAVVAEGRQRSEHQWHLRRCLRLAEEDRGLASIVAKRGMRLRCCSCREQGFRNVLLKNQAY